MVNRMGDGRWGCCADKPNHAKGKKGMQQGKVAQGGVCSLVVLGRSRCFYGWEYGIEAEAALAATASAAGTSLPQRDAEQRMPAKEVGRR